MQTQHSAGHVGREGPLDCSLCTAKNCAKGRSKEALQINRDLDNINQHGQRTCQRNHLAALYVAERRYEDSIRRRHQMEIAAQQREQESQRLMRESDSIKKQLRK